MVGGATLPLLIMESAKLNNIDYNKILDEENQILQRAFASANMSHKYKLYKEARILHKIAEELQKWESLTRGF